MLKIGLTMRVDEVRERRDALDQAWYRVLDALGFLPVLLPNLPSVPGGAGRLLDEFGLSGVILTGGNDVAEAPGAAGGADVAPERDALESQILDACAERALPVLGVCRGFQKMVVHYGGQLVVGTGHVGEDHQIRPAKGSPVPLEGRSTVNSYHGYVVPETGLGAHLVVAALAPDGSVEAASHTTLPQWGIMWHPERDPCDPGDLVVLRTLFAGRVDA